MALKENSKVIEDGLDIRKKHPARRVVVPEIREERVMQMFDALPAEPSAGGLTFYISQSTRIYRVTLEELR